jgi:alkylation response protein AidB-like acyl-CoA dehydrogenase
MDLTYSAEEQLLESSVKDFARDYLRESRARSLRSANGVDPDCWRSMVELGWLSADVAEECGGLGGSITDALLIHEGVGTALILEPLLTVSLGLRLMALVLPPDRTKSILEPYLSGEQLCAVAHEEPAARGDLTFVQTSVVDTGTAWRLQGHKCMVLGAPSADVLLVSARMGSAADAPVNVFSVRRAQLGARLKICSTLDGQRSADLALDGLQLSHESRIGPSGCALPALVAAYDYAILEMCADALGAMESAIALTVDHLKTRKQFGTPLAGFQALQHKLADMVIAIEQARSIVLYGASGIESGDARTRARAVSAARVRVMESARTVSTHAVQIHGGVGVTEDHIISHYYRRLAAFCNRLGGVEWHLGRFSAG